MNAGFPGGPDLVRALLNALATRTNSPNLEAIDTISKRLPLETVFQIARDHLGTPVIEQIISKLDGGSPTPIHQAIAFLAEDHLVRRLYTLNFDTLHERAFRSGPTKVKAIGQSVLCNIRLISGKVFEIVKLHGSADSIGIITLAEYVAGFDPDIKKLLMHDLDASHWLVLGYGGWDVDIHHFLATAIESGIIPSEVLWIDRSFPDAGGRTELLRALSEAGTISHSIVGDVQVIAEGLTSYPLRRGVTWDRSIDDLVEHVKEVEPLVAVATLSECAILSGKAAWAANLLSREKSSTLLRERAFLAESMGNYADAAQIFARLAKRSSRPETRALAATRAFLYSKGEQNVFDQITVNVLPQPLGRAFETFRQTRRTDVGGLERERMRELVRALPSFDDLAKSILNLDAVRLYVSIISESARITHEARDWSSALTSDIAALRFANSIGDQDAIAMCAGNIGACHMGLAEDASKTECSIHLKNAKYWLHKALATTPRQDGFTWALHTCNLGVVLAESGKQRDGVKLLTEGVESLEDSYPNYAICFRGELSRVYVRMFAENGDLRCLDLAINNLRHGIRLSQELDDWDDLMFLEKSAKELDKINRLPGDLKWLLHGATNT